MAFGILEPLRAKPRASTVWREVAPNPHSRQFLSIPITTTRVFGASPAGLARYVPLVRLRIRDKNSVRVSCSSRKQPSIEEVTAAECCFSTPRIIMHK
jgi:hypothetical protein